MVLIQEMALKIDQGFLGALSELFTPSTDPEAERQRVMYQRNWLLLEWDHKVIEEFKWIAI